MKTAAQRAAKRAARARRPIDRSTWKCSGCGGRHPLNERCPIPRRVAPLAPFGTPFGGLELAVIGALEAAGKGRK